MVKAVVGEKILGVEWLGWVEGGCGVGVGVGVRWKGAVGDGGCWSML